MNKSFINKLQQIKSEYANPNQACTQAQSLNLLSSGIYTEEERFVFELIQNAVDATSAGSCLDIKIALVEDYLVFMHNGQGFSERDIEGLCDVGNGNKMKEAEKIGYKGIGFKSVFMHSKCVTVQTGDYCFKFEKAQWNNYWDEKWGAKDPERTYSMPWQIIPIESKAPISIDTAGFNVVTYIYTTKKDFLHERILKLLSASRFLLFLKNLNINISLYFNEVAEKNISKHTQDNIVELTTNGQIDSRWIVYQNNNVKIPETVRTQIIEDGITPVKLQEAEKFDLSFAIQLNNQNQIEPLKDSCLFTYLPTSISFGLPFLVNANFITDAGRQHIVNDSAWNRMIVSQIPHEYLKWISQLSVNYSNYPEVLPQRSLGVDNALNTIYEVEINKAIHDIAFIPNIKDESHRLIASNAVIDRIAISEAISEKSLIDHINRTYKKEFTISNYTSNVRKGISTLADYGVFIFDKQKIKALFDDEHTFDSINEQLNITLVNFLHGYYQKNKSEREDLISTLRSTKFLLDENRTLSLPTDLFFYSQYRENDAAKNAKFLCKELTNHICEDINLRDWIKLLGVQELNDINLAKNIICKDSYITIDNAVEAIRYLFQINKKQSIFDSISSSTLSALQFKTTKNQLKKAKDLFFSPEYNPSVNISEFCNDDIFISADYIKNDNPDEWRIFLIKLGIKDSIGITKTVINRQEALEYDILKKTLNRVDTSVSYSSNGNSFRCYLKWFDIYYYPLVLNSNSFELNKIIWSKALSSKAPSVMDWANVSCNMYYVVHEWSEQIGAKDDPSFLEWALINKQLFPASTGELLPIECLYKNTPIFKELFGKYLPYIDVDCEIDASWSKLLPLKSDPTLDDYLSILTNISKDPDNLSDNKARILKIYERIVDTFDIQEEKIAQTISSWANGHSILSQDDSFVSPKKLRIVTLEDVSSIHCAYLVNLVKNAKVVELLKLMGVEIYTQENVKPQFDGDLKEDKNIKLCFQLKAKILALLKAGQKPTKEAFTIELENVNKQLEESHFYRCDKIKLSFGGLNAVLSRNSYGYKSDFYYVGEFRLSNVDSLLSPLCNYLNISGKERELLITIFEDLPSIKEYLSEKEYDISFLEDVVEDNNHTFTPTYDYTRSIEQMKRDVINGYRGEIIVYEKLKEMGFVPTCFSISDSSDYVDIVQYKGKSYYCKPNLGSYDISFQNKSGKEILIEVKSTRWNKEIQSNMPISYREISLVEETDHRDDKDYYIVRVFNVENESPEIFIFNGKHFTKLSDWG